MHKPGPTFWLMGLLAFGGFLVALAMLCGVLPLPAEGERMTVVLGAVVSLGLTVMLALGWHRFEVHDDGLHVRDLRGTRHHSWQSLGRLTSTDFGSGRKGSVFMDTAHRAGASDPAAYSHRIRDAHGRTLYHVGPWYPTRRALLREILRRTREDA